MLFTVYGFRGPQTVRIVGVAQAGAILARTRQLPPVLPSYGPAKVNELGIEWYDTCARRVSPPGLLFGNDAYRKRAMYQQASPRDYHGICQVYS